MTSADTSSDAPGPDQISSTKDEVDLGQLPPEIWKEIVEFSALSSLKQAYILTRVSKTFCTWTQPILRRTALHYNDLCGWPLKTPNLSWFRQNGSYLRNLLWGIGGKMDLLASILGHCPVLENLGVWVYVPRSKVHLIRPALSKLRLRELSINPFALFSTDEFGPELAKDPMFTHITHFHAIFEAAAPEWRQLTGLAYIPSLTHIALHLAARSAVYGVHEHCKQMQVLIVLRGVTGDDPLSEPIAEKLVVPPLRTIQDWEAGAMGKRDFWRAAEEELAKRNMSEDGHSVNDM
ncbi:hypothetical protein BDN72DRAFT_900381 [Pluteus cervinus]|uniref:Uncharacterized protein n=1 Tax=Pluteus cervinus TaxID=181527 RepID=A0ACD3AIS9_9AGAR|nr:hypothetical protein BDN72DRAFT_900381 [Pluteus cervinus]